VRKEAREGPTSSIRPAPLPAGVSPSRSAEVPNDDWPGPGRSSRFCSVAELLLASMTIASRRAAQRVWADMKPDQPHPVTPSGSRPRRAWDAVARPARRVGRPRTTPWNPAALELALFAPAIAAWPSLVVAAASFRGRV